MSLLHIATGVFTESPARSFVESLDRARIESGIEVDQFLEAVYVKSARIKRIGATLLFPTDGQGPPEWRGGTIGTNGYYRVFGKLTSTYTWSGTGAFAGSGGPVVDSTSWDKYDWSKNHRTISGDLTSVPQIDGSTGWHDIVSTNTNGGGDNPTVFTNVTSGVLGSDSLTTTLVLSCEDERKVEDAFAEAYAMYSSLPPINLQNLVPGLTNPLTGINHPPHWEKDKQGNIFGWDVGAGGVDSGTSNGAPETQNAGYAVVRVDPYFYAPVFGPAAVQAEFDSVFCIGVAWKVRAWIWGIETWKANADGSAGVQTGINQLPYTNLPPGWPQNELPFTPPPYPYFFVEPDGTFSLAQPVLLGG